MAGFDIMSIFEEVKAVVWKIVQYPFKIWIKLPWQFRWACFLLIGLVAFYFCYQAWKERNQWRFYYHED